MQKPAAGGNAAPVPGRQGNDDPLGIAQILRVFQYPKVRLTIHLLISERNFLNMRISTTMR